MVANKTISGLLSNAASFIKLERNCINRNQSPLLPIHRNTPNSRSDGNMTRRAGKDRRPTLAARVCTVVTRQSRFIQTHKSFRDFPHYKPDSGVQIDAATKCAVHYHHIADCQQHSYNILASTVVIDQIVTH